LTKEAYKVTDEEFQQVRTLHGDDNTVAIVLCVAYANFQDRLLQTLALPVEEGGPLPPIRVMFKKPHAGAAEPLPRVLPAVVAESSSTTVDDTEWTRLDITELKKLMAAQQERAPRLPVATYDEIREKLPGTLYRPDRPLKVNWSLLCYRYQPELTTAWLTTMRTFGEEAKQDRVFEETLFWVVTRALNCFY
jgi:hypothetical protein